MEVSVHYGNESYIPGQSVVAMISIRSEKSMHTLTAQACGHLLPDARWCKSNSFSSSFIQSPKDSMDLTINCPRSIFSSSLVPICVFVTSEAELHSHKDKFILRFKLPDDMLPSFKGLSATIGYAIVVAVKDSSNNVQFSGSFGFSVCGSGSISLPYYTRVSSLFTYPVDPLLQCTMFNENEDSCHEQNNELCLNSYKIRDIGLICVLEISQQLHGGAWIVKPGQHICSNFDFQCGTQSCIGVTIRIIQHELRFDNSIVQDKVMSACSRCVTDALDCVLSLLLPSTACCTFNSPIVKVKYSIVFDFHVDKNAQKKSIFGGSSSEQELLSLELPFQVQVDDVAPALTGMQHIVTEAQACCHYAARSNSLFSKLQMEES